MELISETATRKTHKRIIMQVNDQVHNLIKDRANRYNVSITRYILQAIQMRINREEGV